MLNRVTVATIFALLVGLFAVSTATAASPNDRPPIPPPTDYWQDQGFILMAHQGGEWDFPPNTMFAYKKAMQLGADMLDMDAYVTLDGHIVLTHDLDTNRNTESDPGTEINDLTLAQLKALDFAFKWSPHSGSSTTPFKGVATGDVPPPDGFTAEDFQIPTFDEVLDQFPNTPINIELKEVSGVNIDDTTAKMAAILASHPGHNKNVIINSFGQEMLESMHAARPQHLSYSGSLSGSLAYIQGNPIVPTPVAIEPPDQFNLPPWVDTVPILKPWADHDGYKIFVWGSDHDPTQDTPAFYQKLIDQGADSYNTPDPIALAAYLCTAGVARPDGSPRCAQQECPEGQSGIAPDHCADTPPAATCSEGEVGSPPLCLPVAVDPAPALVKELEFARCRHPTLFVGKTRKLTLKVTATKGAANSVKIRLKSSNSQVKVPQTVKVSLRPGAARFKGFTVRATQRAKGKAKITATAGKQKTSQQLYTAKAGKTGSASGK